MILIINVINFVSNLHQTRSIVEELPFKWSDYIKLISVWMSTPLTFKLPFLRIFEWQCNLSCSSPFCRSPIATIFNIRDHRRRYDLTTTTAAGYQPSHFNCTGEEEDDVFSCFTVAKVMTYNIDAAVGLQLFQLEILIAKDGRDVGIQGVIVEVPEIILWFISRDDAALVLSQKVKMAEATIKRVTDESIFVPSQRQNLNMTIHITAQSTSKPRNDQG